MIKRLITKCVNAHDRCDGGGPCPYCEPVWPLRTEDGRFVGAADLGIIDKEQNEIYFNKDI